MSIFQDFERAKELIGEEKWNSIGIYINNHHPELLLDQIIYNPDNWLEYEKWFYKNIKDIYVDVDCTWKTDYGDYRCFATIGCNKNELGNVIVSYDEDTIRNLTGNIKENLKEQELKNAFAVLISNNIEKYIKLPKTSECSNLLKEIYDSVCFSDASMCHIIDYEDWGDFYDEIYSEKDIENLKLEIKKYKLDDVIEVDTGEYLIVGYSDLETRFIDDRNIKEIEKDDLKELEI